ncbi:hypothetical protein PMNALOAF_3163 [Methylobacterium adhaesivum]|nr:hypothetical protein PMNALOAF_3163 [Methylobacterium adhaesivum]
MTLIRFNRMAAAAEDYAQQIEKLGEPHKRP